MDIVNPGIFLPLEDCIAVFSRLKRDEAALSPSERGALLKIEKVLYTHLSVQEVENLIDFPEPSTEAKGRGSPPDLR